MKTITLILISFLFLTGVSEAKEVSYLQYRNDVSYEVNSETPYTGKLVELHWNGKKKRQHNYKNGKQEGLSTLWNDNGQKILETTYKNDKADGLATGWYASGQKKGEHNYKNGKKDGLSTWWDKNGQKKGEATYKDGELYKK